MKLRMKCVSCSESNKNDSDQDLIIEIMNDGIYYCTCNEGHKTIIFIQEQKFEILFDMGAMALLDGYAREAVSSIASSLERFYEFFIEVIVMHNNQSAVEFTNTWKLVKKQSERQLGAFYFLYLLEFKETPEKLKDKFVNFRNEVIHNGYIPTIEEVIEYGDEVLRYINKYLFLLKQSYQESISTVNSYRYFRNANNPNKDVVVTTSIPTIIRTSNHISAIGKYSFREALEQRKEYKLYYK